MNFPYFRRCTLPVLFALVCLLYLSPADAQKMDGIARGQAMSMLKNVKNAIKDDYYDPNYGGMNVDERFKQAEEKLKTAETLGQAFAIIAQAVVDLNDSHTIFYPPSRNLITEYGWRMKMFGDKAFITGVKEKSDAEAKGLKIGDQVLSVNGFAPSRKELWKMIYFYQVINPVGVMNLDVLHPDGKTETLAIKTQVRELKRVVNLTNSADLSDAIREGDRLKGNYRHHFKPVGGTLVWKMPDFAFEPSEVPRFMSEANGMSSIIFDLRGNPGGYVVTLEKLAGYFFEKDTKIADLKGRRKFDPQIAKSQSDKAFKGKVIVLLDSNSGSAAEIFGRLMQIEKRGIVLGDVSAGAVMMSRGVSFDAGVSTVIPYGMNLTRADVIMTDGKSLEHVGVVPDELIIPTGADIANFRDPVMSRALEILGTNISPEESGKFFPIEKFIERRGNIAISLEF